jgi:hypothetical protein
MSVCNDAIQIFITDIHPWWLNFHYKGRHEDWCI